MEIRGSNAAIKGRLRPGEEKMSGVDHGIDTVGYQARDDDQADDEENPTQILSNLVRLVNPTGRLGIVGVYMAKDPKGVDPEAKVGHLMLPWAEIFEKGLQIGMGQAPVKNYNEFLRDMIIAGQAQPDRQPSSASGERAGRVPGVRPAWRRIHQGPAQARPPRFGCLAGVQAGERFQGEQAPTGACSPV